MFEDPPLANLVFGSAWFALLWLPLRLFLAWDWLAHGLEKFSDPKWMMTGEALKLYWECGGDAAGGAAADRLRRYRLGGHLKTGQLWTGHPAAVARVVSATEVLVALHDQEGIGCGRTPACAVGTRALVAC